MKKLKKPKLPEAIKRPLKRSKPEEERVSEALKNVPRITNDTVAEHREEVLSGARKYIYPLQHSKHHVVRISLSILLLVIVGFLIFTGVSLYKAQTTSGFMYDVTRVIPFPVAKVGPSWVSYESYLFELRRNMHYYKTQQQTNFSTESGQAQLALLKKQAMAAVIQDAYVKQLAKENKVTVSNATVDSQVALVKSQNRIGNSDRVFREVLREFWGWNQADFKRELKQQLLQQAVVAKLDVSTNAKAKAALKQLQTNPDFAAVAAQASDDAATKGSGGQYAAPITPNDHNIAPIITQQVFALAAGQVSGIINSGYTLEILKVVDVAPASRHAAHIQFTLQPIAVYVKPVQAKNPPHQYIKL